MPNEERQINSLPLDVLNKRATIIRNNRGGGGIGRRDGLKIRFLRECGFDPHPPYTNKQIPSEVILAGFCFPATTASIPCKPG